MDRLIDTARRRLSNSSSHSEAIRVVVGTIRSVTSGNRGRAILTLCRGQQLDILGYVIFPAIKVEAQRNRDFLDEMIGLSLQHRLQPRIHVMLLDVLASTVSTGQRKSRSKYIEVLQVVSENRKISSGVRAKAIRLLSAVDNPDTRSIVRRQLLSNDRLLVDAAARAMSTMTRRNHNAAKRAGRAVMPFAAKNMERLILCPSVLRLICTAKPRGSGKLIGKLVESVALSRKRDKVLGSVGVFLEAGPLASLVLAVMQRRTPESEWTLRGLLSADPKVLDRLRTVKHMKAYQYALSLAPYAESFKSVERYNRWRMPKNFNYWHRNSSVFEALRIFPRRQRADFDPSNIFKFPLKAGAETGFQLADALYRDLLTGISAQHWHTCIFLGFSADSSGRGTMTGVHAALGIGYSDTMTFFSASEELGSLSTDLATAINSLVVKFKTEFAEGESNHPFHGARTIPGISIADRVQVAATASSLVGKNIWWTWVDMLDYGGAHWNGSVNDIDETRCDGVVEYSYEAHGLRVCGGTDPDHNNKWNISLPGISHPENHNDFHNGDYDPGEICPRIQAGDEASDTRFIVPAALRPTIDEFRVTPFFWFFCPIVYFTVSAAASESVFCRLTVIAPNSSRIRCVRSEDPYGGMAVPLGDWRLMQTEANTRVATLWLGKCSDGTDFRGTNGLFEFRLQVIDQGGNVSDEVPTQVRINWP